MKIKTGFLLLSAAAGICLSAENLPSPFLILPPPQSVTLLKGSGLELDKLQQIVLKGNFKRPVMGEILSQLILGKTSGKGTIELILDTIFTSIPTGEGYVMNISGDKVEIKATGEAGLFYGCQSLEQLLEDSRDFQKPVPACKITDFPALSYRAVHWDVKHHLDHMNYYYESIDRLARYKINAVVFEFEDKLRYQRQPLVGALQAISIDEMAALTRYARERHIEITPLVQGLGHATFILKHQEYANLRELPWNRWAFCPLHEGTYQVLFDLYRDAMDATPGSKYLHVGGDEIGNIGLCPRCKPMADKEGMISLNLYWLKRVCEFAQENSRIPIFWDDMPLKHAGVIESTESDAMTSKEVADAWEQGIPKLDSLLADFPKNCVYMRWNYSMARQPGNIRTLDWYKSRGLKAMIATATNTEGGMLFQADERDKGPASSGIIAIRSFIQLAADKDIGGVLCTAWDDKSPHMENYWRGFIASAEYAWAPDGRTLEEFDKAWLQREFGMSMPDYASFMDRLRKGSVLWYEAYYRKGSRMGDESALQSMVQLEHWLPPIEGREREPFDYSTKLIELPDLDSPGSWSLKYKDRLDRALVEMNQYKALSSKLAETRKASRRNRYFWDLSIALYNLQITAPRVLLALKQCDSDDNVMQKAGFENTEKAMKEFRQAWSDVESVYAQTRYVSYPSSHVPDRYFHWASQREDLTWMIQAEELFFGMIDEWLRSSYSDKASEKDYQRVQAQYDALLPVWISRYENDIIAFEKQDSLLGNPKFDVVFIGSSTFENWKTMQEDFAPARTINRGFGGSTVREVIHYSDRILFPYQPKAVVLYVGNDIWGDPAEPSTEQLFDYFRLFERKVHRQLPDTRLNFVSMRPSPAKKDLLEKQCAINNLLDQFAQNTAKTSFIDIRPVMYDNFHRLRNDIFKSDSLHLNDTGNKLITDIIKPLLIEQLGENK